MAIIIFLIAYFKQKEKNERKIPRRNSMRPTLEYIKIKKTRTNNAIK